MAEWLRRGLQILVSQFDSGRGLQINIVFKKKNRIVLFYSPIAQLVEQLTVNQLVAGSSPARGAKKIYAVFDSFLFEFKIFKSFSFSTSVNFPTKASNELSFLACDSKF